MSMKELQAIDQVAALWTAVMTAEKRGCRVMCVAQNLARHHQRHRVLSMAPMAREINFLGTSSKRGLAQSQKRLCVRLNRTYPGEPATW